MRTTAPFTIVAWISRYFVDARVLSIFEGADETLCLRVIARRLAEEYFAAGSVLPPLLDEIGQDAEKARHREQQREKRAERRAVDAGEHRHASDGPNTAGQRQVDDHLSPCSS